MSALNLSTSDEIGRELGRRLRLQRLAQKISQSELADRASLSKSTVRAIESQGQASLESFIRVVIALGLVQELDGLFQRRITSIADMEKAESPPRQRAPRRRPSP